MKNDFFGRLSRALRSSNQWGNASAGLFVDSFCDECEREQADRKNTSVESNFNMSRRNSYTYNYGDNDRDPSIIVKKKNNNREK